MEEGTEKHRLYHCPEWHAVRRDIPEGFRKWEQKAKNVEERMEMAKKYSRAPLSVTANGIEVTSQKLEYASRRFLGATWPPMALYLKRLESREHVVGRWCRGPLYGEGRAYGICMLSQESDLTCQGAY